MSQTITKQPESGAAACQRRTIVPRHEVRETPEAYHLTVYVPGADRSSVEINVDGETLNITARQGWTAPEGWTAVYRESSGADYRLVLAVDRGLNRDAIRAELVQGVLTVTVPKSEAAKPRRIEIQG